MRRVSQKHIAKTLNVSQTTVSAVLRGDSNIKISEETRQRVLEEAEKGGYWPNRMAGVLLARKSMTIGIAHHATFHQVIVRKLHAVVKAVRAAGYQHLLQDLYHDMQGVKACQFFRDLNVDGVVLIGVHPDFMEEGYKRYLQGIVPVVAIDLEENSPVTQFKSDRQQGFRLLTEHLIAQGHRRFALFCPPLPKSGYIYHTHEMLCGTKGAIRDAGLEPPVIYSQKEGGDIYNPGKMAMARLLDSGEIPDAVICANDSWAIGALSEAAKRGFRVPGQLAIVGFQNEVQAAYSIPTLTSVNPPVEVLAERAVSHLLHEIHHGVNNTAPQVERFPCNLVVRESCGAVLKDHSSKSSK